MAMTGALVRSESLKMGTGDVRNVRPNAPIVVYRNEFTRSYRGIYIQENNKVFNNFLGGEKTI